MAGTAGPPQLATGATSALVPAASQPGGEGQCSGMIYPARAWAISSAQHTTLERQRLPAGGGHHP